MDVTCITESRVEGTGGEAGERSMTPSSRAADAAKQAGVPCDTMQVENARPYQAIIAAASDKGCDLIAMASHGRGGLSAVVLGSVTNKVLTHTKTPVLVYR
jgi:nucleotide-binding universal stress UspA family protein